MSIIEVVGSEPFYDAGFGGPLVPQEDHPQFDSVSITIG